MKKRNFMTWLIGGLSLITITAILLVLLTDINHTIIAFSDMTLIISYVLIVGRIGFKKGIITWR